MLAYLHIPFCHRICPYCSFYKHTPKHHRQGEFVEALATEAEFRLAEVPPRTLYFGGGTPSMLSPTLLRRLFERLHQVVEFARLDEVTLEANPATFDLRKAELFRELGVTRVSLGIQSFDPDVLSTLGREHTPGQAVEAVQVLRDAGIPQINIDLMFSIPGQSMETWLRTVDTAVSLEPDHISAYNLTYEEDTGFFESLKRGDVQEDEDRDATMFTAASERITRSGFRHYETSNYANPGAESRHNLGYWQGEEYLGLGPSAVSTVGGRRSSNVADTQAYVHRIRALGHAMEHMEVLGDAELRMERIAMGLRTEAGIPLQWLDSSFRDVLDWLQTEQLAAIQADRLVLIGRGRALVDPIAAELI